MYTHARNMASVIGTRQERVRAITQLEGQVSRVTAYYYSVRSQATSRQNYSVQLTEKVPTLSTRFSARELQKAKYSQMA